MITTFTASHAHIYSFRVSALKHTMSEKANKWSVGLMDKASASGAGDSRFESWADHMLKMLTDY